MVYHFSTSNTSKSLLRAKSSKNFLRSLFSFQLPATLQKKKIKKNKIKLGNKKIFEGMRINLENSESFLFADSVRDTIASTF